MNVNDGCGLITVNILNKYKTNSKQFVIVPIKTKNGYIKGLLRNKINYLDFYNKDLRSKNND